MYFSHVKASLIVGLIEKFVILSTEKRHQYKSFQLQSQIIKIFDRILLC